MLSKQGRWRRRRRSVDDKKGKRDGRNRWSGLERKEKRTTSDDVIRSQFQVSMTASADSFDVIKITRFDGLAGKEKKLSNKSDRAHPDVIQVWSIWREGTCGRHPKPSDVQPGDKQSDTRLPFELGPFERSTFRRMDWPTDRTNERISDWLYEAINEADKSANDQKSAWAVCVCCQTRTDRPVRFGRVI